MPGFLVRVELATDAPTGMVINKRGLLGGSDVVTGDEAFDIDEG